MDLAVTPGRLKVVVVGMRFCTLLDILDDQFLAAHVKRAPDPVYHNAVRLTSRYPLPTVFPKTPGVPQTPELTQRDLERVTPSYVQVIAGARLLHVASEWAPVDLVCRLALQKLK